MRSTGWQSEFAAYQTNTRSANVQGKQAIQHQHQNHTIASNWRDEQYSFNDEYMGMPSMPYSYNQQPHIQEQQNSHPPEEAVYDEAGFTAAFEQARQHAQEIVKDRASVGMKTETDGSDLLHKDAILVEPSTESDRDFPALIRSPSPAQIRIGSDAIPYQEQKTRTPDQDSRDADELARTAGQLLSSVQHETSDKFQNSQFLALMRKIRDGEVRVEGEEFKETHASDNMVSGIIRSVAQYAQLRTMSLPLRFE